MTENLAIAGGKPLRQKPFAFKPYIGKKEKELFDQCFDEGTFSRFIGSPVGDFRELIKLTSADASQLEDLWSILGGPFVRKFEAVFASAHDVQYAISSNSATSSLISAVHALGIKPDDEIISTPFSFSATTTALAITGAKVIFADVDPNTFCLNSDSIKKCITKKTKAVCTVSLMGNSGDILNIRKLCDEYNLKLIEDSAQSIYSKIEGKTIGTIGDIGVFSFQETKNVMTGEGGMAITNNEELAARLRLIRNHGETQVFEGLDTEERISSAVGYNFRLCEFNAALGYSQMKNIKHIQDKRNENCEYLREKLKNFNFLQLQELSNDSYGFGAHGVALRYNLEGIHRNTFASALRAEGIPVSIGYPRLLNQNPYTKDEASKTPHALELNNHSYLCFLQVGHPNTTDDMEDIVKAFNKCLDHKGTLISLNEQHKVQKDFFVGRNQ